MLVSAYPLPFVVLYPDTPFFCLGHDVTLSIRLRDQHPEDAEARISSALHRFVALAQTGALAGERLNPAHSTIRSYAQQATSRLELDYSLRDCCIADESLVTLCDLLLHRDISAVISSVEIHSRGRKIQLTSDFKSLMSVHPGRYHMLPFMLTDEEPELGTYTFVLTLAEPLRDSSRLALERALNAWTDFVLAGGFGLPPIPPEENYVEPVEPPIDFETTVEWTLYKVRLHPAALDALVNLIAAFHHNQQPLHALTIT